MSLLKILHYPDRRLRKIASPVSKVNNSIIRIVDNMLETMYFNKGIGLAATQVNINKQIIVIDISEKNNKSLVLINPILIEKSGENGIEEGCLSIPNRYGFVMRANKIKIRAIDFKNKIFEIDASNLMSICIQHEMDHLIGKLFIDY